MALKAAITAVSASVPSELLTNADLEKLVETNDEWIRSRTGIAQRHILRNGGVTDIAEPAVRDLLTKRGISAEELDLIIFATVTPDMVFPASANILADRIGAKNAFGYDLNAACSGFLFALVTGAKFIESGTYKKVLIVGADKMSAIIDYTDRRTCIIFGDGGGAVLLEPDESGNGILDAELKADGSGAQYLHMKAGGSLHPASVETVTNKEHFVFQDGQPVFKAAVKGMVDTVQKVMKRNNLTQEDITWLIPHQANRRIIESVASMADFPMEKVVMNIENYGNTTNGTLPICLWEWEKKFHKGDNIMLTAFGGGFAWGSCFLKWAY